MTIMEYLDFIVPIHRENRPGERYASPDDYILQRGIWFERQSLTVEEWDWVQHTQYIWKKHKVGECFHNAQVFSLGRQYPGELMYVEGYVNLPHIPFPIYHAWLALNGKVIDTTLGPEVPDKRYRHGKRRVTRVFDDWPKDWEYLGVAFPLVATQHVFLEHQAHDPLIDDYRCGYPLLREGHESSM